MYNLYDHAAFVWPSQFPAGRNQFVSFIQDVEGTSFTPAPLRLFADTRFRLFVNERFIAYGPARFVTQFAEWDEYDLAPHLIEGRNRIRVEVNFYGTSSYQSMPDGQPGFIADGGPAHCPHQFATPGQWRAMIHRAWDPQAPLFSFAQNPCEILDTRVLAEELAHPVWSPLEILTGPRRPWTTLRPRSAPYPDYHLLTPARVRLNAPAAEDHHRIGYQANDPDFHLRRQRSPQSQRHHKVIAWIHSPRAQSVRFETFWSEVLVNGQVMSLDNNSPQGNHGWMVFPLREGWNLYSATFQQLTEHWSHFLGWPRDAGISLHALPDITVRDPWLISPPCADNVPLAIPDDPSAFEAPSGWIPDSGDIRRITPARRIALDLPAPETSSSNSWMTCFDFGDQYYGQPVFEVDAPAGTILDVAYDDWARPDGRVSLYTSNPFTDAADRYVLNGGHQRIEGLNPRGGIYLQAVLRAPEDHRGPPPRLLAVHIRSRQTLMVHPPECDFHCGEPVIDWTWKIATHTLCASTDEAYADCPWRERGSYIGDSLVNLHLHRLVSADLSIARRTFRMMGEGQHADGPRQGQLASVTPAWHRQGHDDFTLIWILCLRDYWALTGDATLLQEAWPHVEAIWSSPVWRENEYGLWDVTPEQTPFIDWGALPIDRTGTDNLILNAFRLGAHQATADIAAVLGNEASRMRHQQAAERVRHALETRLWRSEQGRFAASTTHESPCLHGQILALLFGAGDAQTLLSTIEPELRANFQKGMEKGQGSGHLELYFHVYLLPALARHGRFDLALDLIQEHFSFLKSLGYPTLNECFCRAARGVGSCCHSWSGYAAVFATSHILGLRQTTPGDPDRWTLAPSFHRFTQVSGILPHADGPIRIEWTREGERIRARVESPPSIRWTWGEEVEPIVQTTTGASSRTPLGS